MLRTILHCDLNNFYVSVAMRDNPELLGKTVAVGGSVEERHGIILAKNEAAKKLGIKTGEPIWQAKQKCPNLVVVPPEFKRYSYFSGLVRKIYERYTDLVEPFGIDECWLDVTGSHRLFGTGEEIANRIRTEVKEELGLTISVGVSFNKIFAKLGSDLKKPDAVSSIPYESFKEIVWPLPVESLLGVGPATKRELNNLAIYTVRDLATIDPEVLSLRLGKNGILLWNYANGNENAPVLKSDFKYKPQSIGRSTTCPKDIMNLDEAYRVMIRLSEEVAKELRKENMEAFGIAVHIRDTKLKTAEFTRQLKDSIQSSIFIAEEGMKLLKENYDFELPLRSLGVRAVRLFPYAEKGQLSLFDDGRHLKRDILENAQDKINEKYGMASVVRASSLVFKDGETAFKEQSPTTLGCGRLSR